MAMQKQITNSFIQLQENEMKHTLGAKNAPSAEHINLNDQRFQH